MVYIIYVIYMVYMIYTIEMIVTPLLCFAVASVNVILLGPILSFG